MSTKCLFFFCVYEKLITPHYFFHPPSLDLSLDKDELHNVVHKFPDVQSRLESLLRSIVDYPQVSSTVHLYNKKAFGKWRWGLGKNYSHVIAGLRWHVDWQKDVLAHEKAIETWLNGTLWTF